MFVFDIIEFCFQVFPSGQPKRDIITPPNGDVPAAGSNHLTTEPVPKEELLERQARRKKHQKGDVTWFDCNFRG